MTKEKIEIRNETKTEIIASACRSKTSKRLYIHVGAIHPEQEVHIEANSYAVVDVEEVDK